MQDLVDIALEGWLAGIDTITHTFPAPDSPLSLASHATLAVAAWYVAWLLYTYGCVYRHLPAPGPQLLPLIGHAAAFASDARSWVVTTRNDATATHGDMTSLNLCGQVVVLLLGGKPLKTYYKAKEAHLSAAQPLLDFQFHTTLGHFSALHGGLMVRTLFQDGVARPLSTLMHTFTRLAGPLLDQYLVGPLHSPCATVVDVFSEMRKVVFLAFTECLVGSELAETPGFMDAFLEFQDLQEECTGKAMVLPRLVGKKIAKKVESKRLAMTTQFIRPYVVQEYTHMRASKGKPTHHTRYIHAVLRHLEEKYDSCSAQEPAELSGAAIDECCEYVIGVLFASHKNVAIGAAQCIVYLLSTPAHTHTHTPTHTHTEALDTSYISRLRAAVAEHELTRTHVLEHWGAEKKGGEKGGVTCDAVMPLLDKVVQEMLRLTQHAIGSMRKVVCKGLDRAVWDDPFTFNPDRKPKVAPPLMRRNSAFSFGAHACPGMQLATGAMKTLVLLWLVSDTPHSVALTTDALELDFSKVTLAQRKRMVGLRAEKRE